MITIVDYGVGNIRAFLNAFKLLNIPARTARTADELRDAARIVLPGVGAFDNTMQRLNASGMRETLDDLVMHRKLPVLGVCVGMQMLAGSSEEGREPGLGWIDGRVRGLRALDDTGVLRLPHMGWNDVRPVDAHGLFATLERDARFYFLHSFYFECSRDTDVAAVANYGRDFSCAVHRDNIYGVQFHPEKSHHFGTTLLKNFATQ
jgi:imidazole glycerol-phosphate synthase subunit HisH